MGKDGSEAFVVILDGYLRDGLAPAVDKLLHTRQVLAGLAIGLTGLANHNALNRLAGYVGLQPVE